MRNRWWTVAGAACALTLGSGSGGWAADPCAPASLPSDPQNRKEVEPSARASWCEAVNAAIASGQLDPAVSGDARKRAWAALIKAWREGSEGQAFLRLYPQDRQRYLEEVGTASLARSFDAASTNPRPIGLLERSGVVELISAAFQGTNLIAADENAVTLNLGAAGLLCGACRDKRRPAATRYEAAGALTRLGGSLTFGAKIPEKDLTGFSGLPSADQLFDAVVWDLKWRLIGDRDPRAAKWQDLLLGEMGGLAQFSAMARGVPVVPEEDAVPGGALALAIDEMIPARRREGVRRISRSLQVAVKFSGQHLTKEPGKDKYTGVLMLDKGLGPLDGNLNVSYSSVQDVTIAEGSVATLKQWRVAGGLVGTILKNAIVSGRGTELTVSGEGLFPVDGADVPLDRKTTYKADVSLKFPISKTLELPFSVTFSNDPNNLAKKRYVTGQVGIHYDFGDLKRLVAGKAD